MDSWSATLALRNLVALILVKRPWLKNSLIIFALLGTWLTATNFFAITLVHMSDRWMKWPQPPSWIVLEEEAKSYTNKKQAIVVLGGGGRRGAVEMAHYQHQDVSSANIDFLRVAAELAKRHSFRS